MPVPDFQSFLLPMLQLAADGGEHTLTDAKDALAMKFNLSESERGELLPSGRQRRFDNRVSWAKVYLQRAGLLTSDRRAHFRISDRGREVLTEPLQEIDVKFLKRFPEFLDFHRGGDSNDDQTSESGDDQKGSSTPEEILEHAYQRIRTELASELLAKVKSATEPEHSL